MMAEQPIDLSRKEVRELWDFMVRVDTTLKRINERLDRHTEVLQSHTDQIADLREKQAQQAGASGFSRWVWPVIISLGALGASLFSLLKKAV